MCVCYNFGVSKVKWGVDPSTLQLIFDMMITIHLHTYIIWYFNILYIYIYIHMCIYIYISLYIMRQSCTIFSPTMTDPLTSMLTQRAVCAAPAPLRARPTPRSWEVRKPKAAARAAGRRRSLKFCWNSSPQKKNRTGSHGGVNLSSKTCIHTGIYSALGTSVLWNPGEMQILSVDYIWWSSQHIACTSVWCSSETRVMHHGMAGEPCRILLVLIHAKVILFFCAMFVILPFCILDSF